MSAPGSCSDRRRCLAGEFDKEPGQVMSSEGPLKRASEGFAVPLKSQEAGLDGGERCEFVGVSTLRYTIEK
jgi:hypothetical protein